MPSIIKLKILHVSNITGNKHENFLVEKMYFHLANPFLALAKSLESTDLPVVCIISSNRVQCVIYNPG